mmetsp:Transcript_38815/g.82819  ORF Transcript_38815/g.82819 Transcript_38815/m.82819 type:complete len:87 (-) Transcript_38815:62-322(-)
MNWLINQRFDTAGSTTNANAIAKLMLTLLTRHIIEMSIDQLAVGCQSISDCQEKITTEELIFTHTVVAGQENISEMRGNILSFFSG